MTLEEKILLEPHLLLFTSDYPLDRIITGPEKSPEEDLYMNLYDYMFWGDYNAQMEVLATKALYENWSFGTRNDYAILKNYLNYTFLKLKSENKILENSTYCLFNTGLYTNFYEPIYIYGVLSRPNTVPQNWFFKGFKTKYELGSMGIDIYPERADYFSDPSRLVFDWHCKINVNYDHILEDNKGRFPDYVINSPRPMELLRGTIDTAIKRVKANYKLAVPHYYNGRIQLMLPLCFRSDNIPELALVLNKMKGPYYQAATCLTMQMAYLDARLIARPESEWLLPDTIDSGDILFEEDTIDSINEE